ncbi:MAG TPA: histidine ammonia-lyase [Phycisphaerales bacterium]|nr:histidine ammonia-lyase [Phycisphaerales bacterium]
MRKTRVVLNGGPLSIADVHAVARMYAKVSLGDTARRAVNAAHEVVQKAAEGDEAVYGVNTGFGSLSRKRIAASDLRELQRNLVRSHAAGVGDPLPNVVVRAMMLILAGSLARGMSGVRVEVIEQIIRMLNADVTPVVPSRGSVGASGDLAPLAHVALVMIGEGTAEVPTRDDTWWEVVNAAEGLKRAKIKPIVLEAKEGLALINGTHMMTAMAALLVHDADSLMDAALTAGAMAIDACRATDAFLDARLHKARNQPGQIEVAKRLRELLKGSEILPSHVENDPRVQDPYSLRAMPQVMGAAMDAIGHVRGAVERELGAVTDNPLVFAGRAKGKGDIVSGGNFHGMPMAISLDVLKIALCHVAGIAERRIFWILAASDSESHVPAYASPKPGLHSGYMIVQYTAAALCNELQTLCVPASVANISTSAGMEDYNSMGATSAHQAWRAMELARNVVAAELLVMAEGLEYHRPLRSGKGVEKAHERIRTNVARLTVDRPPGKDIRTIAWRIAGGVFMNDERK